MPSASDDMRPSHWDSLLSPITSKHTLHSMEGRALPLPNAPLAYLYGQSKIAGQHIEGPNSLRALLHYVSGIEHTHDGVERVSIETMASRLVAVFEWASLVYREADRSPPEGEREIEAILFHGSALSGAPQPKNLNFTVLTGYYPENPNEPLDFEHPPTMNLVEESVDRWLDQNAAIPNVVANFPVLKWVSSCTSKSPWTFSVNNRLHEPFLAIANDPSLPPGGGTDRPFRVFLNTAGEDFRLRTRAP